MKELSKSRIFLRHCEASVMNERRILASLYHPFIVNLHFAFQTNKSLFLVLDMMRGGDFRNYLLTHQEKIFLEDDLKFLAACIIIGIEYIHSFNLIHGDIKPENLVFDENGFLCITDFGIAKIADNNNAAMNSGTPGYMAPEVICLQNHGIESDYFAIGVILYECINKYRPYKGRTRSEVRDCILAKQVKLNPQDNKVLSEECFDFINKIMRRRPDSRLGHDGIQSIKTHPWLNGYDWNRLREKKIESPFKPEKADNFNKEYVDEKISMDIDKDIESKSKVFFPGYSYDSTLIKKINKI